VTAFSKIIKLLRGEKKGKVMPPSPYAGRREERTERYGRDCETHSEGNEDKGFGGPSPGTARRREPKKGYISPS